MYEQFATLTVSQIEEVEENGLTCWVRMPMGAVVEHGWLPHLMDDDLGEGLLTFDLSDFADAPRCVCCGVPSLSLVRVEDPSNEGCSELRCDSCNEEVDEDECRPARSYEPDFASANEVCEADVREPRNYGGLVAMRGGAW